MNTFARSVIPALLILLYAYAAISKLAEFDEFRGEMLNQNFPREATEALVYLVPASELLAIALLLFPRSESYGLWLSLALLMLFSGYIALVLLGFWDRVPCSCGGILRRMGWGTHLAFNLSFVCLNLIAIVQKGKAENLRKE
ncbi:MauE/DoxX family redox-associated membrane protein [Mucilaginibacter pedocola]|nr:MauE/DoxX family redox-associated membrane protein [Mucilaginibacter pedocola]